MFGDGKRLDAFTDAAFAFALTVMVTTGAGEQFATEGTNLISFAQSLPAFAIGFAIIAMFWIAHVRWRGYRGNGDWRGTVLTLVMVFLVLSYVFPLNAMANSLVFTAFGTGPGYKGGLGPLFAIYGAGFAALASVTALLFRDALRACPPGHPDHRVVRGDIYIWLIVTVAGTASTILALFGGTAALVAPWVYALMGPAIGIFVARWKWTDDPPISPPSATQ